MKKLLSLIATLVSIGLLIVGLVGIWAAYEINRPGQFDEDKTLFIEPGTSGYAIAQKMEREHIITQAEIFYALLRITPETIQAGEYTIPARASMQDIMTLFRKGEMVARNVTLAEGLTVKQAKKLLQDTEYLTGDVPNTIAEGSLLPETYSFVRGDTRASIIKRMQDAQEKTLAELWAERDPDILVKTPEEAVTLASIVEKETGIASERAKIAGLFYNRLKIGMPLQSDPTVVYVITNHLGHMGGKPLLGKSLKIDSPYNTYKVAGLPPGPIANPGRASLEAVMHPEKHDYLYFVADGTGGHVFSKDLKGHNQNVTNWRKIKRARK